MLNPYINNELLVHMIKTTYSTFLYKWWSKILNWDQLTNRYGYMCLDQYRYGYMFLDQYRYGYMCLDVCVYIFSEK